MFSRVASASRSLCARRVANQAIAGQRRQMGGGGAFMETNSFGEQVGDIFGTVAWLWIFHRFSQDGAVLLGLRHPWDHGDHGDDHHGSNHAKVALTKDEVAAKWEHFSEKAVIPGEDDDDDDDDEDDDDDDDDE